MKKFMIIQSNPNKTGGFVTKLQIKTNVVTPFGDKIKSETYYVSGSKRMLTDKQVDDKGVATLEVPIAVDMSMFKVVEHDMVNPSTGEVFQGKWLHLA